LTVFLRVVYKTRTDARLVRACENTGDATHTHTADASRLRFNMAE
jgi:hypothetical protein